VSYFSLGELNYVAKTMWKVIQTPSRVS